MKLWESILSRRNLMSLTTVFPIVEQCGSRVGGKPRLRSATQRAGRSAAVLVYFAIIATPVCAADNIPDFSGRWGRNAFNFEPLPNGPQPLTNLKRRADGSGDALQLVGDYMNPILKPEAAAIVKAKGEISKQGRTYADPSNQCMPYAPPFTFAMQLAVSILQEKDRITMVYYKDDQVRHVRLNSSHPAHVDPTWMGDSIAHYEGDTLVIDTIGIKTGPVNYIDRWGTPHTNSLHVIEEYRLIDGAEAKAAAQKWERDDGFIPDVKVDNNDTGKGLQLTVKVEDPGVFTTPWSAHITYRRTSLTECAPGGRQGIDGASPSR
jgi:hypothetical protein